MLLDPLVALFCSSVRVVTGADGIDSTGTLRAAVIATCPILMAGIGGLWSERAGVVNIGLEGQMILGTWGAAYFTYWYGPWQGILGAALTGALGGLLHAHRDRHLRRRPHRLRRRDQHHRRRCRGVPRR